MPLKRISFLPKLFMGGLLIGLTTGSLSSSFYYQKQLTKERQNFLECQLA
jgi:hypothetical protein